MSELERIHQQMVQAFNGNAWHGPALLEILNDIDASQASIHITSGMNSIWQILKHLMITQELMLRRLKGDPTPISEDQDWQEISEPTQENWLKDIQILIDNEKKLRESVILYPESFLDVPLIKGGSSAYNNFQGYIQHELYHAGEINLLKFLFTN